MHSHRLVVCDSYSLIIIHLPICTLTLHYDQIQIWTTTRGQLRNFKKYNTNTKHWQRHLWDPASFRWYISYLLKKGSLKCTVWKFVLTVHQMTLFRFIRRRTTLTTTSCAPMIMKNDTQLFLFFWRHKLYRIWIPRKSRLLITCNIVCFVFIQDHIPVAWNGFR